MRQLHKKRAGFTVTEMIVVIGILAVLASLILPTIFRARVKAKQLQCTSQLRQLHQAITMYDIEHDRDMENYPDRITHLMRLGYVADRRVFICPMDYTHATTDPKNGNHTSLKPYYKAGIPADDKYDWAERVSITDPTGIPEQDCSYLYEFSTRTCQSYDDVWWTSGGWAEDWLIGYDEFGPIWPEPTEIDRNNDGVVTWQEAKFYQLNHGDIFNTGEGWPGDGVVPSNWFDNPSPYDAIYVDGTATPQKNYSRAWLPILRCFWHSPASMVDDESSEEILNLAVDGNLFYSGPGWENAAWKYGRIWNADLAW